MRRRMFIGYEPWVIRSWQRALQMNGGDKAAKAFKAGITEAIAISNDRSLSHEEKIKKLTRVPKGH